MIQLRDVQVTLSSAAGPVKILRGVSLDVDEGSSVSVVGPSGSGKSTLLAVIGGIERPTAGTVRIDGRTSVIWMKTSWPRSAGDRSASCSSSST